MWKALKDIIWVCVTSCRLHDMPKHTLKLGLKSYTTFLKNKVFKSSSLGQFFAHCNGVQNFSY